MSDRAEPPNEDAYMCWACVEKPATESLHGDPSEPTLCWSCFSKIPIAERVRLMLLARDLAHGGLGIVDAVNAVLDFLDAGTLPRFEEPSDN